MDVALWAMPHRVLQHYLFSGGFCFLDVLITRLDLTGVQLDQ